MSCWNYFQLYWVIRFELRSQNPLYCRSWFFALVKECVPRKLCREAINPHAPNVYSPYERSNASKISYQSL